MTYLATSARHTNQHLQPPAETPSSLGAEYRHIRALHEKSVTRNRWIFAYISSMPTRELRVRGATRRPIASDWNTGKTRFAMGGAALTHGEKSMTFTLTPSTGYQASIYAGSGSANSNSCGGTLSGNTYTTRAITAPCTVTAAFKPQTYIITASAGTGGAINPSGYLTVNGGATQTLTVTPNAGYRISSVNGCGKTNALGTTGPTVATSYSFGLFTASCTVTAAFTPAYTVTASAGPTGTGTISPSGLISVVPGRSLAFTITPNSNAGYHDYSIAGACGISSANGDIWTTKPINDNCAFTVTFVNPFYTLTLIAGTGGTTSPAAGNISVPIILGSGKPQNIIIKPDAGYRIYSVGGTCGGTLNNNIYITNAITTNCTVMPIFIK